MAKIHILGDSHVGPFAAGFRLWREQQTPADDMPVTFDCLGREEMLHEPFFQRNADKVHFPLGQMTDALEKVSGSAAIVRQPGTVFGFSMGFHAPRVFREPVWRDFAPWRVAAKARLPALSDAACALVFARNNLDILSFLDAVHGVGADFFVIPAPPARRNHYALTAGTRADVLLEVDRLFRDWMGRELDRRGYRHLPLPEGVIAGDGFLKADYEAPEPDDDHHANPRYGALVAAQMQDLILRHAAETQARAGAPTVAIRRGIREGGNF